MGHSIRIFVVGPRGFPNVQGGIERFSENLYPRLVQQGVDVTSFAFTRYRQQPTWKGVKFIYIPIPNIKSLERPLFNLITALYCIVARPDIVHVHSIASGLFIFLMKMTGLRVIARYNSRDYLHSKWSGIGVWILKLSERQFMLADYIITNNREFMKHFHDLGRKDRIAFVPNGIDPVQMQQTAKRSLEEIAPALVGKRFVLCVGRISAEKNVDTLIEAFNRLKDPDLVLCIVGRAAHAEPFAMSLQQRYASDRVLFMGEQPSGDLYTLYTNCALFVMPSLSEGMPNVLIEAMSFGCQILVSRISAHEQFKFDDSMYFEPLNTEELTLKMAARLRDSSRNDFTQKLAPHDWTEIVSQVMKIQNEVLKPGHHERTEL